MKKKKRAFRKWLGFTGMENGRTERSKGHDILYDCHYKNITILQLKLNPWLGS
jgi:hypothetical protein